MPELPEVEIAARNLRRWAEGRHIAAAAALPGAARLFRPDTARSMRVLVGCRVDAVARVGKNLLITLRHREQAVGVWSHLGMTGKWLRRPAPARAARPSSSAAAPPQSQPQPQPPPPRFARVRLDLDDGQSLFYCDLRLFGRFRRVPGARFDAVPEIAALGPDPLADGIDVGALHARLVRLAAPIKVAVMDQGLLAGVGNIQANEALFRARLDPRRAARSLTRAEVGRLARAIRASISFTLARFVADGVDSDRADIRYVEEAGTANPFLVYGRAGERCRRCRRGTIVRVVQAQRSTFFCPVCQDAPSPRRTQPPRT